jgi:hypothetical protein
MFLFNLWKVSHLERFWMPSLGCSFGAKQAGSIAERATRVRVYRDGRFF